MARIRSIKPEVRRSLTVAEWPREIRLAWIYLWGYLDDHGRGHDDMRLIVAELFPLDRDVTEKKMDKWLELMATTKTDEDDTPPLCRYEVAGRGYLHAIKWTSHQRVSHPQDSRIPPCPRHDPDGIVREALPKDSGTIPERFRTSRAPEELGNKGEEQGNKGTRETATPTAPGIDPLLKHFVDHCRVTPPAAYVKKLVTQLEQLLDDHTDPDAIRGGLVILAVKGLQPVSLPGAIHEHLNARNATKAATSDQRLATGQALVAKYAEPAQEITQ